MPSTAIRYLNYDSARRELRVTFTSGRRYVYEQVPPAIYAAFSNAPSRGAFFNRQIRDRYAYRAASLSSELDAGSRPENASQQRSRIRR
jgi:hypothetical protein